MKKTGGKHEWCARMGIFFTVFQTFTFGRDIEGNLAPRFGDFRPDFFDFNRVIEIRDREAYRVKLFMNLINQKEKIFMFCATQEHVLAVRDLINQFKSGTDPNYGLRVTANGGKEGERWLRVFQDNEKTIPTILKTSQKLSTDVDARNIRNIVQMCPVNSMIEFKQIVGRGTRLFDGKDYFSIYDFVKGYLHFSDPEWCQETTVGS